MTEGVRFAYRVGGHTWPRPYFLRAVLVRDRPWQAAVGCVADISCSEIRPDLTRTREIGIRVALGASRGEVMWLVMREALVLPGVGLAAGLPSAWMLTQLVKSQLYGVAPHDPTAIDEGVLLISLISPGAAYAPGRRAARIDPTEALRCE